MKIRHLTKINTCFFLFLQLGSSAVPASAGGEAGSELGARATAPPVCAFSPLRGGAAENMTFAATGATGATVAITELNDRTNALLKTANINLAAYAVCNVPHQLTIASTQGALMPEAAGADDQGLFLTEIRYRATARWGAETLTLIANGAAGPHNATKDIPTARNGDLTLEIRIDGADNDLTTPVREGRYSDAIRVTFGPQP